MANSSFTRALEKYDSDLRNAVIEECARVAESNGLPRGWVASDLSSHNTGKAIAAAIRALKDKP